MASGSSARGADPEALPVGTGQAPPANSPTSSCPASPTPPRSTCWIRSSRASCPHPPFPAPPRHSERRSGRRPGSGHTPYKMFGDRGNGFTYLSPRLAELDHDMLAAASARTWAVGSSAPAAYAGFSAIVDYLVTVGGSPVDRRRTGRRSPSFARTWEPSAHARVVGGARPEGAISFGARGRGFRFRRCSRRGRPAPRP